MITDVTQDTELESFCRAVYEETTEFWGRLSKDPGFVTHPFRFRILESPPRLRPDLLILRTGAGIEVDDPPNEIEEWPDRCLYNAANEPEFYLGAEKLRQYGRPADWRLCLRLSQLFGQDHQLYLANSVALNMFFFKSPYAGAKNWAGNSTSIRNTLEAYCKSRTLALIHMIRPRAIVTLGLQPFDALSGDGAESLLFRGVDDHSCMLKRKLSNGIPTLGMCHTASVWLADKDRQRIRAGLRDFLDRNLHANSLPIECEEFSSSERENG